MCRQHQSMQKYLAIVALIPLISCQSSAFLHPYSKAPATHLCFYTPSERETKQLSSLSFENEILLPYENIDNQLGDLFSIALNNNPATKSSWAEARAAAASYGENLAPYLPSFGFDGEFNASREGFIFNTQSNLSGFLMNEQIQYGPIVSLSYLLFDGGGRSATAKKYFWMLQQSNFLHNESVQSVMKEVATNYYAYLSDSAQYKADIEDLHDAEESYKAASDKYLAGIFSVTDMLQAKTNFLQKKVNLSNAKNTMENSKAALIATLSIPSNTPLDLKSFPETICPCPFEEDLDKLLKIAKACRGEYLAAQSNVIAAREDIKIAESELLPQLNITANAGEYWYQDGFKDQGNYSVALDLSFPIFEGFLYKNQIKAKKSLLKEAEAALWSTELSIIEQIQVAMNDLNSAKDRLMDTKNYLDAATVENEAMLKRYRHGIVSILDLLSAQAFLADARSQYILTQKDYYTSIISLSFATGMLSTQNVENFHAN